MAKERRTGMSGEDDCLCGQNREYGCAMCDPFYFERAAIREAMAAGVTEVRVEAGSIVPKHDA